MIRATLVCAALVCGAFASVRAQEPSRADGWVVIAIDEYRALRLKAYPPDRPPDPPPVDATITRVEYDLRAGDQLVAGEVRLTVDVLKEGWIRVEVPSGLLVRASRLDGRPVSISACSSRALLTGRKKVTRVRSSRRTGTAIAAGAYTPRTLRLENLSRRALKIGTASRGTISDRPSVV